MKKFVTPIVQEISDLLGRGNNNTCTSSGSGKNNQCSTSGS
jgi:hypothetical protein